MIKEVIKADGSIEKFDLDKLSKWAKYASKVGGDWSELAIETFTKLPELCHSKDIHQAMIDVCYSKQDLVYSRVASRLETAQLRKNIERQLGIKVNKASFKEIRDALINKGVWCKETIPTYTLQQEDLFEELKHIHLESWQVSQWVDKYLLKINGVTVETPAIAAIGIGLGLHGDTQDAYDLARDIVYSRTNLPTPVLNGIRNGDFNGVSCCVISAGDSVESIEVAQHLAVRMTAKKAGIGIEFTTRSKGSDVKEGRIKHLGKHPIYKHTDSGVKQFTQECYDENTEVLTSKGWKLFKHLTFDDLVAQVHNDRSVTYVNPTEIVEYDVVDKGMVKFENRNININVTDNHRMIYRTAKYDDRKVATGGYSEVMAKDFVPSRTKIMDFGGFKVGSVSELTPMQRFLIAVSADGHILENKTCENNVTFTLKKPRKIERLKEILKDLGIPEREKYREKCTCYTITDSYKDDTYAVTVFRVGGLTKNLDWVYDVDFDKSWATQFLNEAKHWDGCVDKTSFEYYSNDKGNIDVVQFVAANAGLKSTLDERGDRECWTVRISTNDKYDGMVTESIRMTESKFTGKVYCCTVPTGILIIRSNGKTLVCGNTRGGSATVGFTCIDPEVYNIALWKSQRIDIEQRLDRLDYSFIFNDAFLDAVVNRKDWYLFDFNDAKHLYKAFYVSDVETYTKTVSQLVADGVKHTKVQALDLIKHILMIRQETGRMYFFNVSRANTHTPFNGVIRLSNLCQEICLETTPYESMDDLYLDNGSGETAFCSLGAIVPVNIKDDAEYKRVAYTLVKTINKLIVKCPKMTKNHERTMLERMSLGVGITGLAEYLYKQGYDYDGSESSLEFVSDLAEKHCFYLYKASQKLSEETGIEVKGVDLNWLPVDTKLGKFTPKMDWESIRGKPRVNSVLIAHMPTESSAVASGVTNGLYPPRKVVINKKSRKGVVQFICKGFEQGKNLLAWDVDNVTLSRYYSAVQDWSDQGISADTYFDPRKFENGKKPLSLLLKEWVSHFKLGNKSMYYVNTYDDDEVSIFDLIQSVEVQEAECESCKL